MKTYKYNTVRNNKLNVTNLILFLKREEQNSSSNILSITKTKLYKILLILFSE